MINLPFMEQNIIFLFLVSSITLTLFPGPDIMFIISTSLGQGRRKGIFLSLGLCSGLIVHTLIVVLGLGNIIQAFPQSIRVIEILGASYLFILAVRLLKSTTQIKTQPHERNSSGNVYFTGLIMNLSNPKVTLFFISFFPGFLFSEELSYELQFLILGGIFFIQALVIFLLVTMIVYKLGQNFTFYKKKNFWDKLQAFVLLIISFVLLYP